MPKNRKQIPSSSLKIGIFSVGAILVVFGALAMVRLLNTQGPRENVAADIYGNCGSYLNYSYNCYDQSTCFQCQNGVLNQVPVSYCPLGSMCNQPTPTPTKIPTPTITPAPTKPYAPTVTPFAGAGNCWSSNKGMFNCSKCNSQNTGVYKCDQYKGEGWYSYCDGKTWQKIEYCQLSFMEYCLPGSGCNIAH